MDTKELICPSCGTRLEEVRKSGFLGCADCYKQFAPYLAGALRRIQIQTSYRGKRNGRLADTAQLTEALENARDQATGEKRFLDAEQLDRQRNAWREVDG